MSITKGVRLMHKVEERTRRMDRTEAPHLKTNIPITEHNATQLISPLSNTIVTDEEYKFVLDVLETVTDISESAANSVAKYIANNITIGLDNSISTDILSYEKISESNKKIIFNGILEASTCERIRSNQNRLTKRFNIDKVVQENMYNLDKIITELCEFIDTYDISPDAKFNIALENIMYSLAKNNIVIESDAQIANAIADYFVTRDITIPDNIFSKYQRILKENTIYDLSNPTPLLEALMENDTHYFRTTVEEILNQSSDDNIKGLSNRIGSIKTEADALDYMEDVSAYIEANNVSEADEARLYYSVSSMPNYSTVSKDFVTINKHKLYNDDRFDKLIVSDHIVSDLQLISEKKKRSTQSSTLFDQRAKQYVNLFGEGYDISEYMNLFEADGFARSSDIKGLIGKFKAEQDKSPNKFKLFIQKLYAKTPEQIIDDLPSVMSFIRYGVLIAIAAAMPIGPIIAGVLGLVSWFLHRHINYKQASKLISTIRAEKKSVQEQIEKSNNAKKKAELEQYLSNLKSCEKKVEEYLDDLDADDHSDPDDDGGDDDDLGFGGDDDLGDDDDDDGDDDFDFGDDDDFDFDDESAIIKVDYLANVAESTLSMYESNIDLNKIILNAAKENVLTDMGIIIKSSSIPLQEYVDELQKVKNDSDSIKVRTAITVEQDKLNRVDSHTTPRGIIKESIANDTITKINEEIIQEKFSLNNVKLMLQDAKGKLKNLDMKQKSLWQSVDANASGFVNSIEKALTSDRRERIIKGNLLPSFSRCIKGAIALAAVGVVFGPFGAVVGAMGALGCSKLLNIREKKLLLDEIDTELDVVEKQIDIAQNDQDMNQYRFLLNYKKKLTREYQRIKYGLKVSGKDIPSAVLPGRAK